MDTEYIITEITEIVRRKKVERRSHRETKEKVRALVYSGREKVIEEEQKQRRRREDGGVKLKSIRIFL